MTKQLDMASCCTTLQKGCGSMANLAWLPLFKDQEAPGEPYRADSHAISSTGETWQACFDVGPVKATRDIASTDTKMPADATLTFRHQVEVQKSSAFPWESDQSRPLSRHLSTWC